MRGPTYRGGAVGLGVDGVWVWTKTPSILMKATKLARVSATAMPMGTPISSALATAAASTSCTPAVVNYSVSACAAITTAPVGVVDNRYTAFSS